MNSSYRLSSVYTFVDNISLPDTEYASGLLDTQTGEVLLLNPEFTQLLRLFQQPASVEDAIRLFAPSLQASPADIQAVLEPTITRFVQQNILTPSDQFLESTSDSPLTLKSRSRIGKYIVQSELSITPPIGVYRVKDDRGRSYVLKKLFLHPKTPAWVIREQQKEFAYEFELLEHFRSSPYITRLIEFDSTEQTGVTTYFAGQSLWRYLDAHATTLSLHKRIDLLIQLLRGMDELHQRGVLHGDLHSSNILVNPKNRIKIIDFDLALFYKDRKKQNIRYGGIVDFTPPERLTDDVFHQLRGVPTFRAEVYQIGVLGYFIIQGKLPFEGTTWRDQINAIRHDAPHWDKEIPVEIIQLLDKALDKKPRRRFASATEMKAVMLPVLRAIQKQLYPE